MRIVHNSIIYSFILELLILGTPAQVICETATVTFDELADLTSGCYYLGVAFANCKIIDTEKVKPPQCRPNGYLAGTVSPPNVMIPAGLECWLDGRGQDGRNTNTFNLLSAYMTAAYQDNLDVKVQGVDYANRVLYSNTYTLNASTPTLVTFNYYGVSLVYMWAYEDGVDHGYPCYSSYAIDRRHFVLDNVEISTDPTIRAPRFTARPTIAGGELILEWKGGSGIMLQQTKDLGSPDWQDIPSTEGQSSVRLSLTNTSSFFRLKQP
jgi:hypothetical protein